MKYRKYYNVTMDTKYELYKLIIILDACSWKSLWERPLSGNFFRVRQHQIKCLCVCTQNEICSIHWIAQDNAHITLEITVCRPTVTVSVWQNHSYCQCSCFITFCLLTDFALCFASSFRKSIHVSFCQEFIFHPGITVFGMAESEVRKWFSKKLV